MFLIVQNAIELPQGILKWQTYFKVDRQAVYRVHDPVVVGLLKKTNVEKPVIAAAITLQCVSVGVFNTTTKSLHKESSKVRLLHWINYTGIYSGL